MTSQTKLPLFAGISAAATSSLCCVGPLILLSFGVGGSWIGNLMQFEPYRPIFLVLAIGSFIWAGKLVYQAEKPKEQSQPCENPKSRLHRQIVFWCSLMVSSVFMTSIYWVPIFITM